MSEPVYGRQTNIEAEIGAARRGIEVARQSGEWKQSSLLHFLIFPRPISGERSVQINTDSEFLVKSHNDWMPKWQQNGWKTSSGAEVKNRESFQRLNEAKQGMDVKFVSGTCQFLICLISELVCLFHLTELRASSQWRAWQRACRSAC